MIRLLAAALLLLLAGCTGPVPAARRHGGNRRRAPRGNGSSPARSTRMSMPPVYDVDGVGDHRGPGERAACRRQKGDLLRRRRRLRGLPTRRRGVPSSVLGNAESWPGQRWLDIRQVSILEPIMAARFDTCRHKGFDAVEADEMDRLHQ